MSAQFFSPRQPPTAHGSAEIVGGNQLLLDPDAGFIGSLVVQVSATDGFGAVSEEFILSVENQPPVLEISDQTIPSGQDTLTIDLPVTDPEGEAVTYGVTEQLYEAIPALAYGLDQSLNIRFHQSYYTDFLGLGEKWVQSDLGWLVILSNGEIHQWGGEGSATNQNSLLATLDSSYHTNPATLHDAELPVSRGTAQIVNGNQLMLDPVAGFSCALLVEISATDGIDTVTKTFVLTVQE